MTLPKNITKKQLKTFLSGLGLFVVGLMLLFVGIKIFRENYNRKLTDTNHYGYEIHQTEGRLKSVEIIKETTITSSTKTYGDALAIELNNQKRIFILNKGNFEKIKNQLMENSSLHIYYTKNNLYYKIYAEILQLEANNNIIYSYEDYKKSEFYAFIAISIFALLSLFFGISLMYIAKDKD